MNDSRNHPYASFGAAIKKLREQQAKSQAEVSGAVEIDEERLQEYEIGKSRPSEDILLLLIQHFALEENAAHELWRLAGYEGSFEDARIDFGEESSEMKHTKTVTVNLQDARVVYTDMVQVMVNNFGVIVTFLQGAGPNNQPLAVSRIGMSKEHAKSVIEVLTKTLEEAEPSLPKQLPSSSNQKAN